MRIAVFATCLVGAVVPRAAEATVRVLERLGHTVEVPPAQTCCGQMHVNTGYGRQALRVIRSHVAAFPPVLPTPREHRALVHETIHNWS